MNDLVKLVKLFGRFIIQMITTFFSTVWLGMKVIWGKRNNWQIKRNIPAAPAEPIPSANAPPTPQKKQKRDQGGSRRGIFFDPLLWNLVVRPLLCVIASFIASSLVAVAVSLFGWVLGASVPINWWLWSAVALIVAAYVARSETAVTVIPVNTVAPITFLGQLYFPVFLTAGKYDWVGSALFLNILTRDLGEDLSFQGFIKSTRLPFAVWNNKSSSTDDKVVKRDLQIKVNAKNGGTLSGSLTLTLKNDDPEKTARADDPAGEIGDRARGAFRTAFSFFPAKDGAVVKDLIPELMQGVTIVTSFLIKDVEEYAAGSIVRDNGGEPLYQVVRVGQNETHKQAVERTIAEFRQEILRTHVRGKMKEACVDDNGEFIIETREIATSLQEILEANGYRLLTVTVGDIVLSPELTKAANTADAQLAEGQTMLKSAEATKQARDKLKPSPEDLLDPTFTDRMALAAASDPGNDGNIRVVHTSGGKQTALGAAIVTAATLNDKGTQ